MTQIKPTRYGTRMNAHKHGSGKKSKTSAFSRSSAYRILPSPERRTHIASWGAGGRRVLRWLVQADRPAPPRTEAEFAADVERHYVWNFTVNLLDVTSFWLGISFLSSVTIVPLFISKLTPSPFFIGLAAMIAQGAWYLPQLFTANAAERVPRKKPVVVNLGFFSERLPMWIIVASAPAAAISSTLALFLFFLGYAWHGFGAGVVATSWQDLIARCFPVQRRGRFLGLSLFLGAGAGALGAYLSVQFLDAYPFPANFFYVFLAAAIGVTVSWFFLSLTREPVQTSTQPRRSQREFFADLPTILRQDANFRRFLTARLLLVLGGMASGFVTVAALQRWQIPDSQVGVYTAEMLIGQTIGTLSFGLLADRFGHKLPLAMGAAAAGVSYLIAWLAPGPGWYDVVFVLMGVTSAAVIVSGLLIVLEFAPQQRRPTYTGLVNSAVGVVSLIGPLLGALLATVSYNLLFAVSAAFAFASWAVFQWWVREPRLASTEGGE